MGFQQMVQWETLNGVPIQQQGMIITPQSQALTIRLSVFPHPSAGAVFVWNRPVAVLVQKEDKTTRIPIVNRNRLAIFLLSSLSMLMFTITWWLGNSTRKLSYEKVERNKNVQLN